MDVSRECCEHSNSSDKSKNDLRRSDGQCSMEWTRYRQRVARLNDHNKSSRWNWVCHWPHSHQPRTHLGWTCWASSTSGPQDSKTVMAQITRKQMRWGTIAMFKMLWAGQTEMAQMARRPPSLISTDKPSLRALSPILGIHNLGECSRSCCSIRCLQCLPCSVCFLLCWIQPCELNRSFCLLSELTSWWCRLHPTLQSICRRICNLDTLYKLQSAKEHTSETLADLVHHH